MGKRTLSNHHQKRTDSSRKTDKGPKRLQKRLQFGSSPEFESKRASFKNKENVTPRKSFQKFDSGLGEDAPLSPLPKFMQGFSLKDAFDSLSPESTNENDAQGVRVPKCLLNDSFEGSFGLATPEILSSDIGQAKGRKKPTMDRFKGCRSRLGQNRPMPRLNLSPGDLSDGVRPLPVFGEPDDGFVDDPVRNVAEELENLSMDGTSLEEGEGAGEHAHPMMDMKEFEAFGELSISGASACLPKARVSLSDVSNTIKNDQQTVGWTNMSTEKERNFGESEIGLANVLSCPGKMADLVKNQPTFYNPTDYPELRIGKTHDSPEGMKKMFVSPERSLPTIQCCPGQHVSNPEISKVKVDSFTRPGLIGDFSRNHILPTLMSSKHPDLKVINPCTLRKILGDSSSRPIIVDCRYPYEYSGGHIQSAVNLYTQESVYEYFMKPKLKSQKCAANERLIIFHCEFSANRGPGMLRFLRNVDRRHHHKWYPKLFFPEMYLLDGGYRRFYREAPDLCEPQDYTPMNHKVYRAHLQFYRRITRCKTMKVSKKEEEN